MNKLYGASDNETAEVVEKLYGSVAGSSQKVTKFYGSANGETKLIYQALGHITPIGQITYYTSSSYTTTATVLINTEDEYKALDWTSSSVVINGVSIASDRVKEVEIFPVVDYVPDNFLRMVFTPGYVKLVLPDTILSIGNGFLYNSSFNSELTLKNVKTIGDRFLYNCTSFNKKIEIPKIESIGARFLNGCTRFNQEIKIPESVTSIGDSFMYDCSNFTSPIILNVSPDVIQASNYVLSVGSASAAAYTNGLKLGGVYAQEWASKFPTRTTQPYRNVGFSNKPVLLPISISTITSNSIQLGYGVSSWDLNNIYTTGEVTLSGGIENPDERVVDINDSLGLSTVTDTDLTGNTRYFYKATAINSGGEELSIQSEAITLPTPLIIQSVKDVGYTIYNRFERIFTLDIPSNGNVYAQDISYRLKKGSEEFGSWTTVTTYNEPYDMVIPVSIVFDTDSEYTVEFRTSTLAGSSTTTYNQAVIPTHMGPTGVEFQVSDNNQDVQDWLSTFEGYDAAKWFIGNVSAPTIIIPAETSGITTDGATKVQYNLAISTQDSGETGVIQYDPNLEEMSYIFSTSAISGNMSSGNVEITVQAVDSLHATTDFTDAGKYINWNSPTFIGDAIRLQDGLGNIKITFSGTYCGMSHADLNSGQDINSIKVEYRVTDYAGEVITDWTTIDNVRLVRTRSYTADRQFSGDLTIQNLKYVGSIVVQLRASDHFENLSTDITLNTFNDNLELHGADYEIELWDWKTNTFVADISDLVSGELNIEWTLNGVEEVSFDVDLMEYEKKCKKMGVDPRTLLKPYVYDIRVRRNREYIVGCQLVQANVSLPNNPPARISIKGTGFLNLFKDQYIMREDWSSYTYAQIARKIVKRAQEPDCIIQNPTFDINTSYWLASVGSIAWLDNSSGVYGHSGGGYIGGTRSGTGEITYGAQATCKPGTRIRVDCWVKGQNGITIYISQWPRISSSTGGQTITSIRGNGSWQHIVVDTESLYENPYIVAQMWRSDSSTRLYCDEFYVYNVSDTGLNNMRVKLGVDEASSSQQATRQVSYALQNCKDALVELTSLEEDNFDFEFLPDRTFNIYTKKGSEKLDLNIVYPGNVDNIYIDRSATNVANKVINIGSGIGDARLETSVSNNASRAEMGTRKYITTNSNISLEEQLLSQAIGELYDRKDPTNLPRIVIKDSSINPSNVQTGDIIHLDIQDDAFLETTEGEYRVQKISLSVNENSVEEMQLTVEPQMERPAQKKIRYIRSSIAGSNKNGSNHWVQIQALMSTGNGFVNVAQGKPVYASQAGASGHTNPSVVTNGSTDTNNYFDMASNYSSGAVTVDLGDEYPIDYVRVWHYYGDNRRYLWNWVSVGNTLPDGANGTSALEYPLWTTTGKNSALYYANDPYNETSSGRTSKWLQQDEVTQASATKTFRYIKETLRGNSVNRGNQWVEIQAMVKSSDGRYSNVAYGKTVGGTGTGIFNTQYLVDGDYGSVDNYTRQTLDISNPIGSIWIDLGAAYPLEYIRVWHYYQDSRVYYGSTLSVGNKLTEDDEPLETIVWQNGNNEGWTEQAQGTTSDWIQAL